MAIETITGKANSPTPIKTPPKAGIEGEQKVALTNVEKNDSVALTPATQQIQKTLDSSSTSPVDMDRVNAVKKALADGSYSVKGEIVAKKLIQLEKLLPQESSTS